ncbi:MAG: amidase family protein, partial [Dehalococcoidia bacterium]
FEVDRAELDHAFKKYFDLKAYERWGSLLRDSPDLLTDYVREGMEYAATLTAVDHHDTVAWIERYRAYMRTVFERYDLLMSPTLATTAFRCADGPPGEIGGVPVENPDWAWTPFTYAVNMAGNPAASIPCGFDSRGLPIGLHVVGRMEDEAAVLAASAAYERAHPWSGRRPPVS